MQTNQPHLVALTKAECNAVVHDDAPPDSLRRAIERSIDYLEDLPPDRVVEALDRRVTVGELLSMLKALAADGNGLQDICERGHLYRVELPDPLLVTGYYQPELPASRERTERFRYPLYRTPPDLVDVDVGQLCSACAGQVAHGRVRDGKLVAYHSRAEIDAGALTGCDCELAWLDDPVEAFFLHIQGSAVLHFDDGVSMQVSYSSSNGRPYTSLGRVLIEQGKLERSAASLTALKRYLRTHADEQSALMAANQRYIFFRTVAAGPVGSLGVPLTSGRSIAADARVYPAGALAFLRIDPGDQRSAISHQPLSRIVVIQDAGAAITGPSRIDVFWGTGSIAETLAGGMRSPGALYLLLPQ